MNCMAVKVVLFSGIDVEYNHKMKTRERNSPHTALRLSPASQQANESCFLFLFLSHRLNVPLLPWALPQLNGSTAHIPSCQQNIAISHVTQPKSYETHTKVEKRIKKTKEVNVFIYYMVCEAIGTTATPGLLYQPRVIVKMIVEKQMKCRLAGETEVLGEILPQCHFRPSQNPTWPDPVWNPGRRGGKPATNRLSYGAAPKSTLFYDWRFTANSSDSSNLSYHWELHKPN
jgi:hypothetical protein